MTIQRKNASIQCPWCLNKFDMLSDQNTACFITHFIKYLLLKDRASITPYDWGDQKAEKDKNI
jgi:hypothetical protein